MSSKTAKKVLNVLAIIDYIAAAFLFVMAVVFIIKGNSNFVKELGTNMKIEGVDSSNYGIFFAITFCIYAIVSFLEGWLMRRVVKDGRKSTFLLVLLVCSTISGVYSLFTAGTTGLVSGIVSLCITLLTLYSVITLRKESNN